MKKVPSRLLSRPKDLSITLQPVRSTSPISPHSQRIEY